MLIALQTLKSLKRKKELVPTIQALHFDAEFHPDIPVTEIDKVFHRSKELLKLFSSTTKFNK